VKSLHSLLAPASVGGEYYAPLIQISFMLKLAEETKELCRFAPMWCIINAVAHIYHLHFMEAANGLIGNLDELTHQAEMLR